MKLPAALEKQFAKLDAAEGAQAVIHAFQVNRIVAFIECASADFHDPASVPGPQANRFPGE